MNREIEFENETTLSLKEQQLVLRALLDIGALLMNCGAEIGRIEDTMHRIAAAYGAENINIFAITSAIVITLRFPGCDDLTQTRRILHSTSIDFYQLELINELSRECVQSPLPPKELLSRVYKITHTHKSPVAVYGGSILSAFVFCLFFGGSIWDAVASGVFAILICLLQDVFDRINLQAIASQLLISLISGIAIGLVAHIIPVLNRDMVIIGVIMLLIPGLAMTNAIRNMMSGDTISGVMRLIESFVWAAALACGFIISMWLTGGAAEPSFPSAQLSISLQLTIAFFGSLGFAILFGVRRKYLVAASLGGLFSWGIYLAGTGHDLNIFLSALLASGFSAIYAEVMARWKKAPSTLFFISAIIPLIPGSMLYYSMSEIVRGDTVSAGEYGTRALMFALGIAAGISVVWSVRGYIMTHRRAHRRYKMLKAKKHRPFTK